MGGRAGECVCNVMKERAEQEEVGAGREEGGEGVKERGAGREGGRERVCKKAQRSGRDRMQQGGRERERRGGGEGQRERT